MNTPNQNTAADFPRVEFKSGRLEVYFAGKPKDNARAILKERGFWWDGRAGCWWLARPVYTRFVRNEPVTTDPIAYALDGLELCGVTVTAEKRAEIKRADAAEADRAGVRGMEIAQGIG
jgi:hypothetical protein